MSTTATSRAMQRDHRRAAVGGPGLVDLDRAATSPLCDEARSAMEPFLAPAVDPEAVHGNPSGSHAIARRAVRALDEARETVAGVLGCRPGEVVFTSGGTESDNHAVTGGMPPRAGSPVCSAVEHHAVIDPTLALGGATVPVDRLGRTTAEALAETLAAVTGDGSAVAVVSVMAANNELGTVNDIAALADVVAAHVPGTPLHTDAVQAAPWLDVGTAAARADLVTVSAHKLGGPKGTGALVVREGTALRPLLRGGSQERDRRGGTHDLAGIVGFAAALEAAAGDRTARRRAVGARRDRLAGALVGIQDISETVGPLVAASVGEPADRSHLLPGHLHVLVEGVDGEELLLDLEARGVCASAASSCASGAGTGSHVLEAIGLGGSAAAPVRLTLGADTTDADVEIAVGAFIAAVSHLRAGRSAGGTGA